MSNTHSSTGILAQNSVLNLLGQVAPMLVGIFTIPYIVHGLGADGYGILSIALMVLGYFSVFDLGLSRATVKFVAEHASPERVHKVPELVWTSLSLLFGIGCLGGILVCAVVPLATTRFFKMPHEFIGQANISLYILAASMPVILGADALRGVLEAAQRFDLVNVVKVPSSISFYVLAALAIPLHFNVPGIIALLSGIRLISGAIYLILCLHVFPGLRKFQISRAALKPLATFGGWVMISNVTGPIFGYLERFLIASVLSVGLLAYYSVPFDLVSKAVIFPASLAPALFPYFSFYSKDDRNRVSSATSQSLKYLLFVMTPIAAIFASFAHDVLRVWLGLQFANQSTVVLQLLAITFFLNAFAFIPFTSVQALGRPELKAALDLAVLPIYAIASWVLMAHFGINGAALAKLLVTIIDFSFLFLFAWRLRAFSVRDCFRGPLSRALLASASLFLCIYIVRHLVTGLIAASVMVGCLLILYVFAFWLLAVDRNERSTVSTLAYELLLRRRTVVASSF